MLEAINLHCEFAGRVLFSALSLQVSAGERLQIIGENGSGKTTLLRILTGLSFPVRGNILWQGEPLARVRLSFAQNVLWGGHQPGIHARLSALENLHIFHPQASCSTRLLALEQAGLTGFDDLPVGQLSQGQQRRVALARLWLSRAPLWILDEPFTSLDAAGVTLVLAQMAQHTADGGAIVFTAHQPLDVAVGSVRYVSLAAGGG